MTSPFNIDDWEGTGRTYVPGCGESEYTESEFDPKEEAWDDWEREDQYETEPKCLFCSDTFELPEDAFLHCKETHGFDFLTVKRTLKLDFYQCIRMINYIRKQVLSKPELSTTKSYTLTGKEDFWNDDALLQPVLENDALLFAFEELEIADGDEDDVAEKSTADEKEEKLDLSTIVPTTDLEHKLLKLLRESEERAAQLETQFNEYRAMVKRTFLDDMV